MIGSKKLMHFLGCFVSIFVIAFFVGLFFDINPISAGDESYIQLDVGTPGVGPVGWAGFKWEDLEGNSGFVMSDGNGIIQIPVDLWENRFELNEGDIGKRFYVSQNCTNFRHSELECDTANVIIDIVADSLGKPVTSMRYENGGPVQFFAGDSEYIFNDNLKPVPKYIQLYVGLYSEKINNYGPFSGGYVIGEDELGNVGGYSSNAEGLVKIPADFIGERYELTGSDIGKTFYVSQDCENIAYNQYVDTLDVDESFACDEALVKIEIEDNNSGDIVVLKYKKEYGEWNLFENDSGYIFMNIIGDTAGFITMDVGVPGLGVFEGGLFVYEDLEGNSGFVVSDENGIIQIPVDYTSGGMIYRDELNESDIGKTFYIHQVCDDFDYDNLICDTSVVRIDIVSNTSGDPVASYHYVSGKLSGDLVKFSDFDSKYIFNNEVCGSAEIKAKLTSENNVLQTGIFEFVLKEDGTTIATARNNTNGNIIFEKMKYTIPGTYIYTISQNGCPVGYVCDSGEIEVQVNVVDNGDGTFATSTMYSRGGTNSPDYNEFPFQNTPVYTATFDANGADSIGADVITGATITLPSITRLRYLALGWSTDSGATVAEYAVGENITLTEDIVLYAITKPLTASFLDGQTFNITIKSLATGATVTSHYSGDTLIQQVIRTGNIPAGVTTGLLSVNTSEVPVIGWFDNGILYYYTEAEVIYLNQNSNYMFYQIRSGTYIDTSGWDTSKVVNMRSIFGACKSLTNVDVSNFDTSSVRDMGYVFFSCSSLTGIDLNNWDTSNVRQMDSMFRDCINLINVGVDNWNISSLTTMSLMFYGCNRLKWLNVSNWNPSNVVYMDGVFMNCSSLTGLNVSEWDTSNVTTMGAMFHDCSSLTELDVSNWNTSKVTDMSIMFDNCSSLTELDVSERDTKNVVDMNNMFSHCSSLTALDVSNFDTSNVTNMGNMFSYCSGLTELNLSNFDTSNVTNMEWMFLNCRSLTHIDVSNFDTSNVTNMNLMFSNCRSLTSLDVSNFDTSSVKEMAQMFSNCRSLTGLDLSRWDTSNVTKMNLMFHSCRSLSELNLTSFDTSNVTTMGSMFYGCSNIHTIYASTGFEISGVTSFGNMFTGTSKLIGGHGTKWNSSYIDKTRAVLDSETQSGYLTYDIAVSYRTRSGVELARQVINVGDTTVAPSITGYNVMGYYTNTQLTTPFNFSQELRKYTEVYVDRVCADGYRLADGVCEKILTATFLPGQTVNLTLKSLATGATVTNCLDVDTLIQQIVRTGAIPTGVTTGLLSTNDSETPIMAWFDNGILYYYSEADILYLNQDSNFMFYNIKSGAYIDTSGWDTSRVINMISMFAGCSTLTGLDVSDWDTSKVTNMQSMFQSCNSITGLDVSEWNTSKVTNMSHMFGYCSSLTSLDVSNFDTSSVTNMQGMFSSCSSLTSLDVSNFDTSKVANMGTMFAECKSLTELDVSSWNTSNVTNMGMMFYFCRNLVLTGLNVRNWNTSNVTSMFQMFTACGSLTGLDVSRWDTSNVTNMEGIFSSCHSLNTLDVSEWDTSSVTNMKSMFSSCSSLTGLDVSNWDTSSVINMSYMFSSCRSLNSLDISEWETSTVTNMENIFSSCNNLKTIYASTGFTINSVVSGDNMFSSTSKLVGGHGTKYNNSIVDKTRAVLDSESASGYLTYDIAVSYRTRSGVELAKQVINVGDTTVAPSIIRTGYAVSGWYTDTGLTTLFDFSQSLRKYTELYVMWKCDTGYMLSGDGVTCVPLTYEVRHFIKNPGELSYTLSGTEIFTGIAGEQVYFDDLSQTYPSCIVYSRGSLTGDENGPGEIETKTDISGDGSTVINLYYDRNTYTVDLSRDFGIDVVEGAGTYECGQEVQIRAYPIDGYHFDMWEGEVD